MYRLLVDTAVSEITFLKCPDKISEQAQNCSDIMEFWPDIMEFWPDIDRKYIVFVISLSGHIVRVN